MTTRYSKDDIRNYSVEENFYKLEQLIKNNPELWSDRYMMGTGQQLLRLISAGQSIIGVKTLMANQESFASSMQREDSLLGFSESNGYCAFRGQNEVIQLTVIPNQDIILPKRHVIGSVQDYDLVLQEDYSFQKGMAQLVNVKVGNRKIIEKTIPDSNYRYVRFLDTNISNDYIVYKNGILKESGEQFKDLLNNKCVVMSNSYGSVDIWFLNSEEDPVVTGDKWKLDYIEYVSLDYTLADIVLEGDPLDDNSTERISYGVISNGIQISPAEDKETIENLRINSQYYHDVQREILANRDPVKYFGSLLPTNKDVNVTPLNTVHSLLTYCYEDKHLIDEDKIKDLEEEIKPAYYFGYCPSTIEHPVMDKANLKIDIELWSAGYEDSLYEKLENIISDYDKRLNQNIDMKEIEYKINLITDDIGYKYVKIARVSALPSTSGSYYEVGDVFNNGGLKRVRDFYYTASGSPTAMAGTNNLKDNEIILVPYRSIWGVSDLVAGNYKDGDIIIYNGNYYRVSPAIASSNPNVWNTEIGGLTYQNQLIWLTIPYVVGSQTVQDGVYYLKGNIVKIPDADLSAQLIGFRRLSSETSKMEIEDIQGETTLKSAWNHYNIIKYVTNIEV